MPKMMTKKPHKYRGQVREVGDSYDALPHDVETLRKTGWADFATAEKKPAPAPKKVNGTAKAEGKSADNTYQTKHLEAE